MLIVLDVFKVVCSLTQLNTVKQWLTCNGLGPVILWVGVLLPVGGVGGSGGDTNSPINAVL